MNNQFKAFVETQAALNFGDLAPHFELQSAVFAGSGSTVRIHVGLFAEVAVLKGPSSFGYLRRVL